MKNTVSLKAIKTTPEHNRIAKVSAKIKSGNSENLSNISLKLVESF